MQTAKLYVFDIIDIHGNKGRVVARDSGDAARRWRKSGGATTSSIIWGEEFRAPASTANN